MTLHLFHPSARSSGDMASLLYLGADLQLLAGRSSQWVAAWRSPARKERHYDLSMGRAQGASCSKPPLIAPPAPVIHCQILANTIFKKECSECRNNNDNSDLLPAPVRLWPEKRWEGPIDWS